jgi:hypothetical protein
MPRTLDTNRENTITTRTQNGGISATQADPNSITPRLLKVFHHITHRDEDFGPKVIAPMQESSDLHV